MGLNPDWYYVKCLRCCGKEQQGCVTCLALLPLSHFILMPLSKVQEKKRSQLRRLQESYRRAALAQKRQAYIERRKNFPHQRMQRLTFHPIPS